MSVPYPDPLGFTTGALRTPLLLMNVITAATEPLGAVDGNGMVKAALV
jgi:hypothetical protein